MDTYLKKYCFKLKNGSACFLNSNDEKFDYLVTTKHLFEMDEFAENNDKISNNERIEICFLDEDLSDNSFFLNVEFNNNVFFHNSVDMCIMLIPKIRHLKTIYIEKDFFKICYFKALKIIGYPNVNRTNKSMLKQSDSISVERVEDANNDFFKIECKNSTLNYKNISGISGGGLFSNSNGKITLLGIQSEMQNSTLSAGKVFTIPIGRIMDIIRDNDLPKCDVKNIDNVKKIFSLQYYLEDGSFYIERDCDLVFSDYDDKNLWIFGDSGCGKTAYLFRNLKGRQYHFFDLSMVSILNIDDLYHEIINKFEIILEIEIERNLVNKIKSLFDCFSKVEEEVVLVFDEFRFGANYEEVLEWLNNLVVYQNKNQKIAKRFIISTIQNPMEVIKGQRSIEYLNYIDLNNWDEKFIELYNVYSQYIVISDEDKVKILSKSNNNPRVLVNILKEITCYNQSIDKILKD